MEVKVLRMENYLRELAARVLRISRTTMDIGTGRKLRELADDIRARAEMAGDDSRRETRNTGNGNHPRR